MKTGIRTKFLAIIALATLVPLAIAVLAIQTIGYNHLVKERGVTFQAGAAHVASSLKLLANAEVERVYDFLALSHADLMVQEANKALEPLSPTDLQAQISGMEARWPRMQPDDPELAPLLKDELAERLRAFQRRHPLFVEIFVTDREGRLIASTEKTTDYWQADEEWWTQAVRCRKGEAWLEGLQFDESSATFSLDISVPIATQDGAKVGVLKASLNASPFFSAIPMVITGHNPKRDIVREDGAVLLRWGKPGFQPASVQMQPQAVEAIKKASNGWAVRTLFGEMQSMAGFAALDIQPARDGGQTSSGLSSMFIVIYEPASVALQSLRRQVTLLAVVGGALVLLFGSVGLWIANHRIIKPLQVLRSAAEAVAATVKSAGSTSEPASRREAVDQLNCLENVNTGDELQALAGDFRLMGHRVIRYQQQLEEEVAAKTASIQQDLDMAREFQAALMPSEYPAVPEGDGPDGVNLVFHHVYRPASSVGGDFFDVLKISGHQAGVFIADVMGHGARSALVTAILRTLLQTYAAQAGDPAALLALINRQFHDLTRQAQQTLFVTACYMVVDTLNGTVECASAGHPSPILTHRNTGCVERLFGQLKSNPALGLFPSARYSLHSHSVEAGDLIVLYTDGVVEAANPAGEEFGVGGLTSVILDHLEDEGESMANLINNALTRFVESAQLTDDVCLVTIDVCARATEAGLRLDAQMADTRPSA